MHITTIIIPKKGNNELSCYSMYVFVLIEKLKYEFNYIFKNHVYRFKMNLIKYQKIMPMLLK